MDRKKKVLMFLLGGAGYVGLEHLWRGWSHVSMFFAGGICFLLLGKLEARKLPLPLRAAAGAAVITGVELLTGFAVNRSYRVWDYRNLPFQFLGQICLPYTLLWVPLSLAAMSVYRRIWHLIPEPVRENQ